MNVCRDTSSVKIVWALWAGAPYAPVVWVVDGFSFDKRKRACEPPASHTMKRGRGKRSVMRSCHVLSASSGNNGCFGSRGKTYSGVFLWLLQQCRKVFVSLLLLIASFPPFCNGLAVENKDVEEGVE